VIAFALAVVSADAVSIQAADSPSFMLISGVSAASEMCLSAESGTIVLEPCTKAIAAGDGRELWQNTPSGQITSAASKKCIAGDAEKGITLTGCDDAAASQWEAQGNGQLRLGGAAQFCLSQKGSTASSREVAASSAISSSSTADPAAHGANKAVDGSSSSFWASALDPTEPVIITLDLGGVHQLQSVNVDWEFPPKSFAVGLSEDGVKWTEAFATDSNVLASTSLPLGLAAASQLRIVMHEAHSLYGKFKGHAVFGVASLQVYAVGMQSIVEDCAAAAKSKDARDKYFQSYVGDAGASSSSALRSEVPSLEAATASVASTVSELVDVLPKLASCRGTDILLSAAARAKAGSLSHTSSQTASAAGAKSIVKDVDAKNSIQVNAVNALMKEARRAVIAARAVLF